MEPEPQTIRVGDWVQYKYPARTALSTVGRVNAIEKYTDDHGTRTFVYIRWLDQEERPDREYMRLYPEEIEVVAKCDAADNTQ